MGEGVYLSEAKRKLLEGYLRGDHAGQEVVCSIPLRPRGEPCPLSLVQEHVWRRAQLCTDMPPFYNESITVHRNGPVNLRALERSLTEILGRNEVWRTTFDCLDGRPAQIVNSVSPVSLPVLDLSHLPQTQREHEAVRLAADELRHPFDLKQGPLVRPTLIRLDRERFKLFLAVHQIVLDGVTAYQVFFPELVSFYNVFSRGQSPSIPESAIQFADYAYWQRRHPDETTLDKQLCYWQKQLAGADMALRWPSDYSRPAHQTYRGSIYPFVFPLHLSAQLKALSQRHNVTLFALLMAAFAALLHAYAGQHDIIIGTVAPAGRNRSEVQSLMGYFLNPVAIRTEDLSDSPPFTVLLQRTQETILGALANADVPFECVAAAIGAKTDPSRHPVAQIAASLEPPVPDLGPGWDLTPMDVESGGAKWDLYFVWEDRRSGISGRVQYNPDLFRSSTVSGMVQDFQDLLDAVICDPGTRVATLAQQIARWKEIK
jgi:Condensation domain